MRDQRQRVITHKPGDLFWRDGVGWAVCLAQTPERANQQLMARLKGVEMVVMASLYVNCQRSAAEIRCWRDSLRNCGASTQRRYSQPSRRLGWGDSSVRFRVVDVWERDGPLQRSLRRQYKGADSRLPQSNLGCDTRLPGRFAEILVKGVHDHAATRGQVQRIGKISALGIPLHGVAYGAGVLDDRVLSFQQGHEKGREFWAVFFVTAAQYPFAFHQHGPRDEHGVLRDQFPYNGNLLRMIGDDDADQQVGVKRDHPTESR